jgi:hypothetical protein
MAILFAFQIRLALAVKLLALLVKVSKWWLAQ